MKLFFKGDNTKINFQGTLNSSFNLFHVLITANVR